MSVDLCKAVGIVGLIAAATASAAAPVQAAPEEDVGVMQEIDFSGERDEPRAVFLPSGMAWEVSLELDLRHAVVRVPITLPESGELRFVESTSSGAQAAFEIEADGLKARLLLRPTVAPLSRQRAERLAEAKARELVAEFVPRARQEAADKNKDALRDYLASQKIQPPQEDKELPAAYVAARTVELGNAKLVAALQDLASKHPTWIEPGAPARWSGQQGRELWKSYQDLLTVQFAVEHVHKCGIKLDAGGRGARLRIESKFEAIHSLAGPVDGPQRGSARVLDREEADLMRQIMHVEGAVRFFPATNPQDANSQWFNAQRLACQARGAAAIEVNAELHPQQGDSTDWWHLLEYDAREVVLHFPPDQQVKHQLFSDRTHGTRLRVAATSENPVRYRFTVSRRPSSSSATTSSLAGPPVVLHESPGRADAHFPY